MAVILHPVSFGISLGSISAIAAAIAALGGTLLVGRRYATRHEYQADDYAGEHAGREEMAPACSSSADTNDVSFDVDHLDRHLSRHPPVDVRIDGLEVSESP